MRSMNGVIKNDFARKPWKQERPIRTPEGDRTVILETSPHEVPEVTLMIDNDANVSGPSVLGWFASVAAF